MGVSFNQKLEIANLIRERGATSRLYISRQINIALPTVSTLVRDLIKRGVICENGYGESAGGRKPAHLRLNPGFAGAIGVEVSSRRITGAIADVSGTIRVADRRNSPDHYCRSEILQAIFSVVESLLSQAGDLPVKGIGLGISGLIDGAGRVSRELPLAEGWKDVPLAAVIEERFGQPVTLVNAVHAATLGEWRFSPREGAESNMLFLHMGRGIAAGLIVAGQLYQGATGNAGEFGHSVVRPDGPICHCGARGCLESVASPKAIVEQVREAIARGVRSSITAANPAQLTLDHVLEAAQAGDRLASNVVHEAGDFIGGALASLVNVLNPHVLVMGGVLSGGPTMLSQAIERAFRSRVLPALKDETRIRHSRLGQDAGLLGAAALVFDAMFRSPKRLLGLNGQDLEGSASGKETAHEGDRGSEQG